MEEWKLATMLYELRLYIIHKKHYTEEVATAIGVLPFEVAYYYTRHTYEIENTIAYKYEHYLLFAEEHNFTIDEFACKCRYNSFGDFLTNDAYRSQHKVHLKLWEAAVLIHNYMHSTYSKEALAYLLKRTVGGITTQQYYLFEEDPSYCDTHTKGMYYYKFKCDELAEERDTISVSGIRAYVSKYVDTAYTHKDVNKVNKKEIIMKNVSNPEELDQSKVEYYIVKDLVTGMKYDHFTKAHEAFAFAEKLEHSSIYVALPVNLSLSCTIKAHKN